MGRQTEPWQGHVTCFSFSDSFHRSAEVVQLLIMSLLIVPLQLFVKRH